MTTPDPHHPTGPGTILITGASSGIGRATAHRLAAAGHDVVLLARREGRLRDLAEQLSDAHGVQAMAVPTDLTRTDALAETVDAVLAEVPGLAGAVLAAGHGRGHGAVREADTTAWASQLQVNLLAPMLLTKLLLPSLDRNGGRLILIGSVFGHRPMPGYAPYAAAKHGLAAFARSLALEERPPGGCRVSLLSPGATNTEFASVLAGEETPRVHDVTAWPYHPLLAEDVARAVAWILRQPPHVRIAELQIDPTDAAY
ncbi:SDR family oxidoreductase [Streptomyces sp. XD-27]|uniref:SDR family oxidoreductase n=1 Tax=Streptomyces sp. XD-27 TaxID=3062779 RepID=UPI0026F4441D|nr:SDR family oxidoreductase [Streptomyces sp. XD-27]WKX73912.1 SDR family oxidoreductase [Streptomyces sp. XD-27]